MSVCTFPGCCKAATNQCSSCRKEWYCSGECQKSDWKTHKRICKTLQRLSNQLQPYEEVIQVITDIQAMGNIRALEHVASYAVYQFGDRLPGKLYRERRNGGIISNFDAEIRYLMILFRIIADVYRYDPLLNQIQQLRMMRPYVEKSLNLLRPWALCLELDGTKYIHRATGRESFSKDHVNTLLSLLAANETEMAIILNGLNELDLSENHCRLALIYARRFEGEENKKTQTLYVALVTYCTLRSKQCNYAEALVFAEEAYDVVAIAYNPVHIQVQQAASYLIEECIHTKNFYDARRYAEVTLDNLKDPRNGLNQDSLAVADGYHDFANVIMQAFPIDPLEGDLAKAELLERETLRIRGLDSNKMCKPHHSTSLLGQILRTQGNLGDETRGLYELALANYIKEEGMDSGNVAVAYENLGHFYEDLSITQLTSELKKESLSFAKSYYEESMRIDTKIYDTNHAFIIEIEGKISKITCELSDLIATQNHESLESDS